MKFVNWVKKQGKARVAVIAGLSSSAAVGAWLEGRAFPRGAAMIDLVKAGNGAFSYQDILLDLAKLQKAKAKKG